MDGQGLSDKTIRLSTSGLSDTEAFDYRNSMSGSTYRLHIGSRTDRRSSFRTTMRAVGGHVLSDFRSTPIVRSRDVASVRKDARRYVKIRQYVSGEGGTVVAGGRSFRLGAGDIHVLDQSCEFTEICHGGHQYNLLLPQDEIGFDPGFHAPCVTFARRTPAGRMLDAAFGTIFPCIETASSSEAARATSDLVAILRFVLDGAESSEGESTVVSARARAARRLVADNLANPDLDPSWVVRLLGVSRATLYRDFTGEGGLERYIYRSRLEQGFDSLVRSRPERGLVDRVAVATGFGSIHHFSNAFREHFGLRPSEVCGLLWEESATEPGTDDAQVAATVREGRSFFDIARGIAS